MYLEVFWFYPDKIIQVYKTTADNPNTKCIQLSLGRLTKMLRIMTWVASLEDTLGIPRSVAIWLSKNVNADPVVNPIITGLGIKEDIKVKARATSTGSECRVKHDANEPGI